LKSLYCLVDIYQYDQSSEQIKKFKLEIEKKLQICNDYIEKLNNFHSKYSKQIDFKEESPIAASLLLFIKAINLLFTISDLLSKYNLSSFLLNRSLSESIALAAYFLLANNDKEVEKNLQKWFRLEKSPHTEEVNKKLNNFNTKYDSYENLDVISFRRNIQSNYLSKPIHNTYNDMLRFAIWEINDKNLEFLEFKYDKTNNLRDVLIYVLYLQSNILDVFSGFQFCFEKINKLLSNEDINSINIIIKELAEIDNRGRFKIEILSYSKEANFNF
jgi:hypothetical protein